MEKTLKTKEDQSVSIASNLFQVQEQIAFLKEQEDEYKAALLETLKRQGVKSVRLENGTNFTVAHRETLKIKNPEKAEPWLDENNCWKPDTTKATAILRRQLKLPSFFRIEKGEPYLTIKRAQNEV